MPSVRCNQPGKPASWFARDSHCQETWGAKHQVLPGRLLHKLSSVRNAFEKYWTLIQWIPFASRCKTGVPREEVQASGLQAALRRLYWATCEVPTDICVSPWTYTAVHWMNKETYIQYLEERRLWQFSQWLSRLASLTGVSAPPSEQDLFLAWVKVFLMLKRKILALYIYLMFWWNRWGGARQNIGLLIVYRLLMKHLVDLLTR